MHMGYFFFTTLPTLVLLNCFANSHSTKDKVTFPHGLLLLLNSYSNSKAILVHKRTFMAMCCKTSLTAVGEGPVWPVHMVPLLWFPGLGSVQVMLCPPGGVWKGRWDDLGCSCWTGFDLAFLTSARVLPVELSYIALPVGEFSSFVSPVNGKKERGGHLAIFLLHFCLTIFANITFCTIILVLC